MVKVKLSNFELLKVVAMLMIVCHHLITQNAFNIDTQLTRLNASRMFCQFIGNHAFVGNNLFFMMSAWFLCTTTETFQFKKTVSRIWSLEKVMLFYSIGIPVAIGLINDQWGSLLKIDVLFPISRFMVVSYGLCYIFGVLSVLSAKFTGIRTKGDEKLNNSNGCFMDTSDYCTSETIIGS